MKLKRKKLVVDFVSKITIFIFSLMSIMTLVVLFLMILQAAFPAYRKFGFFHMYFTADFSAKGNWGVWKPLFITLITSFFAVLIATPIALRAAIFLKWRVKFAKKAFKTIVNILAGVPSVIFGVFALGSFSVISKFFIKANNSITILNATLVLVVMVFPTLFSLIYNQLESIPNDTLNSSIALGNSKTYSIYKVGKKKIQSGIYVAIIVSLGRAIGETMALSMILPLGSESLNFSGGIFNFFAQGTSSLGVEIAKNFYTDSSDPLVRSALFAAGIALFFIIMILIIGINKITQKKILKNENPFKWKEKFQNKKYPSKTIATIARFWYFLTILPRILRYFFVMVFEFVSYKFKTVFNSISLGFNKLFIKSSDHKTNYDLYLEHNKSWLPKMGNYFRIAIEAVFFTIVIGSLFWITLDIFVKGVPHWEAKDWRFTYEEINPYTDEITKSKGIIGNTLSFTIVLVLITIVLATPFSFGTALFLSEYARDTKTGKTIKFFIDSLNGTPSILFGIFGVLLFRNYLQIANGGLSVIAAALTMVLVIIPTFTRSIEQSLIVVPNSYRNASYALGASKFETIRKVVIPNAFSGIVTGVILSSGRIISETAPVYLLIGMMGNIELDVMGQGWTMTTKILFNQVWATPSEQNIIEVYKIASVSFMLVGFLITIAEFIKPIYYKGVKPTCTFIKNKFKKIVDTIFIRKNNGGLRIAK